MIVLGLTAPISWNPAAAIFKDQKLLAAVEEERFLGLKHAPRLLPLKSIDYCLISSKINAQDVDAIVFGYRQPLDYYLRSLIENFKYKDLKRAAREAGAFAEYYVGLIRLYDWLKIRGFKLEGDNPVKIKFYPHHLAHAASAFRCSGFKSANTITLDGQGEDDSGSVWYSSNRNLKLLTKISSHQSLGWLYSDTTDILGFKVHSHEGKTMGLSAWGKKNLKLGDLFSITPQGYVLKHNWNNKLWQRFGPRRDKNTPLSNTNRNLALTIQTFTQEAGVSLAKNVFSKTRNGNFCLSGGVALNCDMNSHIWLQDFIENIYIQPASNDAGTAIGAALEFLNESGLNSDFTMDHPYWGPEYQNDEIENYLKESKINYQKVRDIEKVVSKKLSQGKIVGWFQGRLEIGPRALGNRSILGHPGLKGMKDKINREVKHRETWRPFAPSVLHEAGPDYFQKYCFHPFMVLGFNTNKKAQKDLSQAIHIDNTARIQSVTSATNPRYYRLIKNFASITGIPALLNTSFNDAEQPLVLSPKEAIKTYFGTGLDLLAIGDFILEK